MMINMKLEREEEKGTDKTETETNTKYKYKRQIQIYKTNKQTQSYNGPSQQPRQDIEGEFRQSKHGSPQECTMHTCTIGCFRREKEYKG